MTRTVSEAADGDRLLLAVARQGIWWLALLAGASLAENAALLLLPAAIGQAINAILARSGTASHIAACVLLVVVIVVADAATDLASGISGAMSTGRLRRTLAAHIVNLGPRLFTSFGSGDTVSRLDRKSVV